MNPNPDTHANTDALSRSLEQILERYQTAFAAKTPPEESPEEDDVMLVFGLTQSIKARNKQYWGHELGMCWQRLVTKLFRQTRQDVGAALRSGGDELCDLVVGSDAIDTKYRIGSGDSGTLKKFRRNGEQLSAQGYTPILLIVRNDNLPAALTACTAGTWVVLTGEQSYAYIYQQTRFDLRGWLRTRTRQFSTPVQENS